MPSMIPISPAGAGRTHMREAREEMPSGSTPGSPAVVLITNSSTYFNSLHG